MNLKNLILFLGKKRIKISTDLVDATISDINYTLDNPDIINYNSSFPNDYFKNLPHPLVLTKISWHIIQNLESLIDKPLDKRILSNIIHQSEYLCFYSGLKEKSKLFIKTRICRILPHKKGTKITIRFDYFNGDILVATEYSGGLLFGVKCTGKPRVQVNLAETARLLIPQPLWETNIEVSKKLPFEYAGKANIDAPIHTDYNFARSLGLKNVLLQGTCVFALAVNALYLLGQIPAESVIKEISAKFTGMVYPGSRLTIRLLKKDAGKFYFDVLDENKQAVIKGGQVFTV
ncbi:MAG: MaoC/PaaZ C-terminal domain-containing protein [Bacteroidales bacterium]